MERLRVNEDYIIYNLCNNIIMYLKTKSIKKKMEYHNKQSNLEKIINVNSKIWFDVSYSVHFMREYIDNIMELKKDYEITEDEKEELKTSNENILKYIRDMLDNIKENYFTCNEIKKINELKEQSKHKKDTRKNIETFLKNYDEIIINEEYKEKKVIVKIIDGEEIEIYYKDKKKKNQKIIMFDRKQV